MKTSSVIILVGVVILLIVLIATRQKKNVKEEDTFSNEKWNKMIDLWVDYELDHPIKDVLTYDAEINNGGHLQFFENCNDELDEMMISLKENLPEDIYINLKKAYDVYTSSDINIENVDDYVGEALEDRFGEYDSYYYNNNDKVNEVLRNYASTLELD